MNHLNRVLLTILLLALLGAFSGTVSAANKVTICHVPPGNPDNAHSITVSKNAVDAHMAHGDSVGSCGEGSGGGGGSGSSSAPAVSSPTYVVCDDRVGETGRIISVSLSGRLNTEYFKCD